MMDVELHQGGKKVIDERSLNLAYDEIVAKNRAVMGKKQMDYSSDNITRFGLRGVIIRMYDKWCRLENLTKEHATIHVKDESLRDTLLDMANYAIIGVMLLDGDWGKDWVEESEREEV